MSLIRVVHNKNYTIINNFIATDDRLSWKAKGIFLYAFSRPEDWSFNTKDLVNKGKDGIEAVYSGLAELKKYGYLICHKQGRKQGIFQKVEWTFFEVPQKIENEESKEEKETKKEEIKKKITEHGLLGCEQARCILSTDYTNEEEESKKSKALEKKEESEALERKLKLIKSKTNGRINLLDAIAIAKKYPYCVIAQAFEKYSATKKKIKNPLAYLYKIINELNVHLSADEKAAFEKVFTHNELASVLEALKKFGEKHD